MRKSLCVLLLILILSCFALSESLRILTPEEPPTNYVENGQIVGTSVDIVHAIVEELGIDAEIELLPWARAYNYAKKDANIVIFTCGMTEERKELGFHFIGPVITRKHLLIKRKNSYPEIKSFEDIKANDLVVGGLRDSWRVEYIENMGIKVEFISDHALDIKKLAAGRIPFIISSDIEAVKLIDEQNLDMDDFEMSLLIKESPSYIMISKDTPPEIISQWEQAFEKLQTTDFFTKTAEKWSELLGLELHYSPDKGFFVDNW